MKNMMKRIILCLAAAVLVFCSTITASADDRYLYRVKPYYIQSYDVNINVLENNTLEITEKIHAFFNQQKHGIIRDIPLINNVKRADGSEAVIKAKIKNINVSEEYDVEEDASVCSIQIGDADAYVKGDHDYEITYSYYLGKDPNEDFDELYYNIIGDSWDTYIRNITFTITMPKEFDVSGLGFSSGAYGTVGTDSINYKVNGNVISGNFGEMLSPNNALTIRLELPDGYFYFNQTLYNIEKAMIIAIPALALLIVVLLWARYGKDKKVIKTVEFYPPENMSSADVAYWSKGVIVNQEIVPLLIELANEGYLEICEGQIRKKKTFTIKKLKPSYDGNDEYKRIFFDGLFACSNSDIVSESDLTDRFYKTLNKIETGYNSNENRKKVFSAKSLKMRMLGWIISIISIVASIFISMNLLSGDESTFMVIGVAIGIIAIIMAFFIRKRNDDSHTLLEKIEGFKMFLETAEKDRLETLVEENPTYFYDILPYAYVLGVSKKWMSKFESIAIEPPRWYGGAPGVFDYYVFYHFMNHTMSATQKAMTSSPQDNTSGGGFSSGGGGFAGGGAGGGGGRSW